MDDWSDLLHPGLRRRIGIIESPREVPLTCNDELPRLCLLCVTLRTATFPGAGATRSAYALFNHPSAVIRSVCSESGACAIGNEIDTLHLTSIAESWCWRCSKQGE